MMPDLIQTEVEHAGSHQAGGSDYNRVLRWFCVKAFSILLLLIACKNNAGPSIRSMQVMEGFVYVGSLPATVLSNGEIEFGTVARHDSLERPIPSRIEIGTQYIFHYGGKLGNGTLASDELPKRIKNLGFTVIRAPKESGDFMYPTFSGPLFVVRYADGAHVAVIFNGVDPQLDNSSVFRSEDYVLLYLR